MDYEWLVSSLLVFTGLGIGFWQYIEARRKQLLVDLQGDKNAVAAVAMRVWSGRFPRWPVPHSTRHRRELFEALCLAAVFQRSGRSRSLIYGALADAGRTDRYRQADRYREEIRETVDRITKIVSRSSAYTDLTGARRRLTALRAALRLDPDVRVRLDRFELDTGTTMENWPPDSRLSHCAFKVDALKAAVQHVGTLVLVGPPKGSSVVVALDYHRAARGREPERWVPTSTGASVIAAKYGRGSDRSERNRSDQLQSVTGDLATRLAAVIERLPAYRGAAAVAGVPGREHDFSDRLAEAVAAKSHKPFVTMARPVEPASDSNETPRFTAEDRDVERVKETVILVDDVYRSGQTLQAAAAALLSAGAREVLGLSATCTISAAVPPCGHDSCDDDQPDAALL
jgi:hypothetical protein